MVKLALRSLALCRRFAVDLGINVWFRPGGYLFLAPDHAQVARLERNAALHAQHGMRTRLLSPVEALEVVPHLDPSRFVAASWNPDDGVVFPWPFLWGYATQAEALGVKVRTFARVTGLRAAGARLTHVETDRGAVACELVVNAAGAWSKQVAALAGVVTPNRPTRHEILVGERRWKPLVPFFAVSLLFGIQALISNANTNDVYTLKVTAATLLDSAKFYLPRIFAFSLAAIAMLAAASGLR